MRLRRVAPGCVRRRNSAVNGPWIVVTTGVLSGVKLRPGRPSHGVVVDDVHVAHVAVRGLDVSQFGDEVRRGAHALRYRHRRSTGQVESPVENSTTS